MTTSWMIDVSNMGGDKNRPDDASGLLGMFLLFVLVFFAN